ncbi:MAG: DUF4835 domain-containing protein, partial [Planctomycetota bacterium]
MTKYLLIFALTLIALTVQSQELNCNVQVISQKIQGDKTVFQAMQKSIYEFINTRKWTSDIFKSEERIECSIMINITERASTDAFRGTIQIQSRRPIYGTSYNSTLINYIDKDVAFNYV